MKVTAVQKIEALTKALSRIAYYREHDNGCQIGMTEFCTCGLREAVIAGRAAACLEVEETPNAL
jgi:hypothetical protein